MQISTGISTAAAAHDALAIAPDDALVGTSRRHPSRLKMEDIRRNGTNRCCKEYTSPQVQPDVGIQGWVAVSTYVW